MAIDALTGALLGVSAASGIASSLFGSDSEARRQRRIRQAHNRYNAQRDAVYGQLAQDTQRLWQQNHQARAAYLEALTGQERARQAQERQAEVLQAVAQAMPQDDAPAGRSGSARSAQQRGTEQAGQKQELLNALLGAQAAGQGRAMFDQGQQGNMLQTLLPNLAQAQDYSTMAQGTDMQNRLALEQRLAQLQTAPSNDFADALGLVSGLSGNAAMLTSLFGGGQGGNQAGVADPGFGITGEAPTPIPGGSAGAAAFLSPIGSWQPVPQPIRHVVRTP